MPSVVPTALVAVVAFAVFASSIGHDFVMWDDDANFLTNEAYRGLRWTNISWMLTSTLMGHWIPVTWLTFGLDFALWGMDPRGYHFTNVALHAVNAALVFLLARRLLAAALREPLHNQGVTIGAVAAALFWAIHPLRAESVAWVTERRDVVSGVFYFATLLCYTRAVDDRTSRRRWLGAALGAYALALMSKSIVMTLPAVLLVLDVYPFRRLPGSWRAWREPVARQVLYEKLPFIGLATAGAATALAVLVQSAPLTADTEYPALARPLVFLYALTFYTWKTIVPAALIALYEMPRPIWRMTVPLGAGAAAAVIVTTILFVVRRRWPAGLAAWLVLVVSVAPVGGLFVHNGSQIVADRYTYLATLGIAFIVGGAASAAARGHLGIQLRRAERVAVLALAAVWLAGLAIVAVQQTSTWRDSETLWRHALEFDPDCAMCENRLGRVEANGGATDAALVRLERAVTLRPDRLAFHKDLVTLLFVSGRTPMAIGPLRRALAHHPGDPVLLSGLGVALLAAHQPREAEALLRDALSRHRDDVRTLSALGFAISENGHVSDAVQYFRRAIDLAPDDPEPRYGLARAYFALGRRDEAAAHVAVLRRRAPQLADKLEVTAASEKRYN